MSKRIVLIQKTGPHAGLYHIAGTDEGFESALPVRVDGVTYPDEHVGTGVADLVKSTERMHVYEERV